LHRQFWSHFGNPRSQLEGRNTDYIMYSTFLTSSSGSVLFSRSNLLKRKDLCFSCLRLGLIRHLRSLRSSHLSSQVSVPDLSLIFLESLEYLYWVIIINSNIELFSSSLSKCFRCSNESNQKAFRDHNSKVEIIKISASLVTHDKIVAALEKEVWGS
jgi:hypothetical protein